MVICHIILSIGFIWELTRNTHITPKYAHESMVVFLVLGLITLNNCCGNTFLKVFPVLCSQLVFRPGQMGRCCSMYIVGL